MELDRGEPLPDWREFDAVLAMGGPMGAGDDDEHPWLAAEKRLVAEAVGAGRSVPGRLPGRAALGRRARRRVYEAERAEVGLLEVELTAEGRDDPLFAGFDERFLSLQWHGDTFELPAGRGAAGALADSPRTRRFAPASGPTACSSTSRSRAQMAREWGEVPAYRRSLRETLGEERGAAFIADVERREGELHPGARRLFANWLDVGSDSAR